MIAFLIANWKILAGAGLAFGLALMLHKLDVHRIEAKHAAEIVAVKAAALEECNKAQAITRKVSHDYQIKLDVLNTRIAVARRMYSGRCIAIQSHAAAGYDAASAGKELSGGNAGASAEGLIDLAGRCERVRLQLISCQSFVSLSDGAQRSEK